jgi:hypothetical protein
MKKVDEIEGRDFSIELVSNQHLRRLAANGGVLIEGTLGKLLHACFVEEEILEVKGNCGVLRLNLRKNEITAISEQKEEQHAPKANDKLEGQL